MDEDSKVCYRCYKLTNANDFYIRNKKVLGVCVTCYEQHYKQTCKSEAELKKTLKDSALRTKNKRRAFIKDYLLNHPCMDCGLTDLLVLEFDHREPKDKLKNISSLLSGGSITQIKKELEKCDVVCANCHRRRTSKMFGNWRLDYLST